MSTLALALGEFNLGTATFLGAVLIVVMPTIIMVLGCCVRAGSDGADAAAVRCAGCAYDLRASTSGRCPECGHAVARCGPVDALDGAALAEPATTAELTARP